MAFFGTKGDDRIWAGVARLTKTSSRSRSLVRSGERAPVVTPPRRGRLHQRATEAAILPKLSQPAPP